jgi:hypothetical protein
MVSGYRAGVRGSGDSRRVRAAGWRHRTGRNRWRRRVRVRTDRATPDGRRRSRIFAARASDTSSRGKTAVEAVIVGLAYRAAQAAAVVSQECDFRGDWDFGLAVTDLRGAISSEALYDLQFAMVAGRYPEAGYRASTRASAGEVASAPLDIATRLTDRLNRVLNDRRFVLGKRG